MSDTSRTRTAPSVTTDRPALWLPGVGFAALAALAAVVVAAGAHGLGASLEVDGEQIPLLSFAQLAFFFSVLGVAMAAGFRRWSREPATWFVRTTLVLTAVSLLPDLFTPGIDAATRATLMLTHLVTAAVLIPAVADRLRTR